MGDFSRFLENNERSIIGLSICRTCPVKTNGPFGEATARVVIWAVCCGEKRFESNAGVIRSVSPENYKRAREDQSTLLRLCERTWHYYWLPGPESIKRGFSFHSSSWACQTLPCSLFCPQRALLPHPVPTTWYIDIPQSHHVINTTREEARQSSDGCLCVAWRGVS